MPTARADLRPLLAALLLAGCAGTSPATPAPAAPAEAPPPSRAGDPAPGKPGDAPPAKPPEAPPGFDPPASLPEGDRWFVTLFPGRGTEPVAVRHRLVRAAGVLRQEVTWGRSFAEVASASRGTMQVFALLLDAKGLAASLVDGEGRPAGEPRLEVAAPFRVGTAWTVALDHGARAEGRIEALEDVETPGGKVRALRVRLSGPRQARTNWYDAGLLLVRSRTVDRDADDAVIEASAALASPEPSPGECRAALEWAKGNLGK